MGGASETREPQPSGSTSEAEGNCGAASDETSRRRIGGLQNGAPNRSANVPIMLRAKDGSVIQSVEDRIIREVLGTKQADRHTPGGWHAVPGLQPVGAPRR